VTPVERPRRTNAERTAETRGKLLDAAVATLVELGYAGTSTNEVAKRAGVSRGAMLHHFPAKQDLMVAAVEHAVERHTDEVLAIVAAVPEGPDRVDVNIDLLWSIMRGPTFAAPLELMAAARTDPELRPVVAAFGVRMDEAFQAGSEELFPQPADETYAAVLPILRRLVFAVLYGLALESYCGAPEFEVWAAGVLELLKGLCRMLETAGRVPEVLPVVAALLGADPVALGDLRDLEAQLRATRRAGDPDPAAQTDPDSHPEDPAP